MVEAGRFYQKPDRPRLLVRKTSFNGKHSIMSMSRIVNPVYASANLVVYPDLD